MEIKLEKWEGGALGLFNNSMAIYEMMTGKLTCRFQILWSDASG